MQVADRERHAACRAGGQCLHSGQVDYLNCRFVYPIEPNRFHSAFFALTNAFWEVETRILVFSRAREVKPTNGPDVALEGIPLRPRGTRLAGNSSIKPTKIPNFTGNRAYNAKCKDGRLIMLHSPMLLPGTPRE